MGTDTYTDDFYLRKSCYAVGYLYRYPTGWLQTTTFYLFTMACKSDCSALKAAVGLVCLVSALWTRS